MFNHYLYICLCSCLSDHFCVKFLIFSLNCKVIIMYGSVGINFLNILTKRPTEAKEGRFILAHGFYASPQGKTQSSS